VYKTTIKLAVLVEAMVIVLL